MREASRVPHEANYNPGRTVRAVDRATAAESAMKEGAVLFVYIRPSKIKHIFAVTHHASFDSQTLHEVQFLTKSVLWLHCPRCNSLV